MRADASAILLAGIRAVDPEALVAAELGRQAPRVRGRIVAVGLGKAAERMMAGAVLALGDRLEAGLVVAPTPVRPVRPSIRTIVAGHPLPDGGSVEAALAARALAAGCGPDDLFLGLVSGGGSSMLALPEPGVSLVELRAVTAELLAAGASIAEVNCVRRHADRLKGGGLAREAGAASILTLAISDVPGDRIEDVASGPLSAGASTAADARAILDRHRVAAPGIREHLARAIRGAVEPKPRAGDPCFRRARAVLLASGRTAAEGARAEAEARGYATQLLDRSVTGEARLAGVMLAGLARRIRERGDPLAAPACVLATGETVVVVRGDGRGGRNQELALAAALELDGLAGVAVASAGTDGIDGPTDAAGALATGETVRRAAALGLDARIAISRNDSYGFFRALGDLIVTGPTGTNVADLQVVLVRGLTRRGTRGAEPASADRRAS